MATDTVLAAPCGLLARGSAELRNAGVEAATQEVRWIWEAVSGAPMATERFVALVQRRTRGEPLAHVLGSWQFRHLTLTITPDVLIPRPETEGLVDLVLERTRRGRVLDLGTGSGCIALALAMEGAFERVVAVDRSRAALAVAATNARLTGLAVDFVQGNFGEALGAGSFDVIVSNPPYLTEGEYLRLDPAVRHHEPRLALASGPDGLDATRVVLAAAARLLRPGGWVALELDSTRAAVSARLAAGAGLGAVTVHQDLFARERFLLAQRSEG
jgi:release factor glutamine methyltransferase